MPEQDTVSFMDLPPELRERVYSFLFISPSPIAMNTTGRPLGCQESGLDNLYLSTSGSHTLNTAPRAAVPALAMANRLLRHECLHVYYGRNCFNLGEGLIKGWLYSLSDEDISKIRRLRLDYDISHFFSRPFSPAKIIPDHTIRCHISLTHREPWYIIHIFCESDMYQDGCLRTLKDKMDGVLRRTLQKMQESTFNLVYLMKLYEFWLLLCYQLLIFGDLRVRPYFPEEERMMLKRRFLLRLAENETQPLARLQNLKYEAT